MEEAVAVAGKSVGDARNFRDVDARAYDHERYVSTMARQAATALLLLPAVWLAQAGGPHLQGMRPSPAGVPELDGTCRQQCDPACDQGGGECDVAVGQRHVGVDTAPGCADREPQDSQQQAYRKRKQGQQKAQQQHA